MYPQSGSLGVFQMATRFPFSLHVLCGVFLVAALSAHADTIWKVVDHPIVSPVPLGLEEIGQRVTATATRRGWAINDDGQQKFRARIATSSGRYEAVVGITYTDKAYSITLLESKGFRQRGDSINSRANRWIKNLEQDIERAFLRAPPPVSATSLGSASQTIPAPIARPRSGAFPPVQSSGTR